MNATTRFNAQHSKWAFEHKKYQHNYNHPKHPGLEPQWVPPCSRSILKQREDRDGNIFSVSINDKHEQRPMKNGNVFFDEKVNDTRYVDFLFHPNAAFVGCANWENEMVTQFERWQEWRRDLHQQQKLEWDEEMELPLDTKIRIIKPKTRCTLAMNIPMSKLRDHGDSITMYKEITNIFKHYNYSQRKNENAVLIPIESIRTVSRGFKNKNWMVKKTEDWRRWLNKNSEYFKKCNPKKQLQLKQKIYYDHIYTNTIYVEFNTWLDNFPDSIDYKLGDIKLRCTTTKETKLEKVMRKLYQCYTCGGIACADRSCRHFNSTVEEIQKYNSLNGKEMPFREAKEWMGRFCQNCGQIGGHYGRECHREMHCKWCGSNSHDNNIDLECSYWNAIAMLCLLYYPYYIRNQQNEFGYLAWKNYLDTNWKMDEKLIIEENTRNSDIYPKLCRQLELIKLLCKKDDFFGTSDETIDKINQLNDKVFKPLLHPKDKKNKKFKKSLSQNDTAVTTSSNINKNDNVNNGTKNNENNNEIDNESESKSDNDIVEITNESLCRSCFTNIIDVQCYKSCLICNTHICNECLFDWSSLVDKSGFCPGCKMTNIKNPALYKDMTMNVNDLYDDFNSSDSDSDTEINDKKEEKKQNFTINDTNTMPMKQKKARQRNKQNFNYKKAKKKNNNNNSNLRNRNRKRKNAREAKCLPPNKRMRRKQSTKLQKARARKQAKEKAQSQLIENELKHRKAGNSHKATNSNNNNTNSVNNNNNNNNGNNNNSAVKRKIVFFTKRSK